MKNLKIIGLAVLVAAMLMTTGCGIEPPHEHTFAAEWTSDGTYHWHAATCEHTTEVSGKASHSWGEGEVTKAATCTTDGEKTFTCTVCGEKKTETIPAAHTWNEGEVTTEATCTEDGEKTFTCTVCGEKKTEKIPAAHTWNEGEVTTEANCTTDGEMTFTCTVCGETKTETISAGGHTYAEDWTSDDTHHWHEATCEHTDEVSDKAEHDWGEGEVTKEATADEDGEMTYTCAVCESTKTEVVIALNHTHAFKSEWSHDGTYHWHAATCENEKHITDKAKHTWDGGAQTKEATADEDGEMTYTCTVCGEKKTEAIPMLNHEHTIATVWSSNDTHHWHEASCGKEAHNTDKAEHTWDASKVTKAATCTETGEKTFTCTVCKKTNPETETIPAKGHDWVIVGGTATTRTSGTINSKCSVCGETKNETGKLQVPNDVITLDTLGAKTKLTTDAQLAAYGITASSVPAKIDGATYYTFGVYPQTIKADDVTVDKNIINLEFDAVDYYLGDDGNWYAESKENAYKTDYTYSDGTTVAQSSANSYKYFKVEPIVWRKLEGTGCLLAEKVLVANVPYYNTNIRTLGGTEINRNNYKYSNVRAWLNGINNQFVTDGGKATEDDLDWTDKGFLYTAFTQTQRSQIKTTTVDNTAASTTDATGDVKQATAYACVNTSDKIFLLSLLEASKTENGFEGYEEAGLGRIRVATDYAKANRNQVFNDEKYGGCWWLRSPVEGEYASHCVRRVSEMGAVWYEGCSFSYVGIVPALNLTVW